MRKFLLMLFLPPALACIPVVASATTYKCVLKGITTYSQVPCGKHAERVNTQDALAGVREATPLPPTSPTQPTAPSPRQRAPAAKQQDDNSCAARMKAYQDSLACFAPYRHSAHVIDVEAYKHCKVVAEPDCS